MTARTLTALRIGGRAILILLASLAFGVALTSAASAEPIATVVADPSTAKPALPPPPVAEVAPAVGSGSAVKPSDTLADPVDDPIEAVYDVRSSWREGWALGLLAALVIVSRGLGTARRRWPSSGLLRWMGGRPGLLVLGVGTVGAAAFDALALGGSWFAAAIAAIGAALALLEPGGKKENEVAA